MKMKEETERERFEQVEQEEIERQKRYSVRRSSSPAVRQSQPIDNERSAHSEPIPPHTQFVSFVSVNVSLSCTT